MKLVVTIFFILLSVGSTVFEFSSPEFLCPEEIAPHSIEVGHSHKESSTASRSHCHDSNCIGSAHFGHGYYCWPSSEIVFFDSSFMDDLIDFNYVNHHSLVYLDSLFRPPLV